MEYRPFHQASNTVTVNLTGLLFTRRAILTQSPFLAQHAIFLPQFVRKKKRLSGPPGGGTGKGALKRTSFSS